MLRLVGALLLVTIGCGGEVTGSTDEHGCLQDTADMSGTATASGTPCTEAGATIAVVNGTFDGQPIAASEPAYDAAAGTCEVTFAVTFDNGCDGVYSLTMPAR